VTSPAEIEVVALTVVVVAAAATVVEVTATGAVVEGDAGAFCHLSFLPTLVQIRGLDAEPPKIPAREHLPPTLAADTCWVGMVIAKTLATITAIILKVLNITES
jgi:hypothetical protein